MLKLFEKMQDYFGISHRNAFLKLALPLLLVVTIVLSSTSAILYTQYRRSLLDILDTNLNTSVEQIDFTMAQMRDKALETSLTITLDPVLVKHLYYFEELNLDAFDYRKITQQIKHYNIANPYIHSVYIYNRKANRFISSVPNYTNDLFDDFFDQEIKELVNNYPYDTFIRPIPRTIPAFPGISNSRDINVFTFIQSELPKNRTSLDRCIIINISEQMIKDNLNALEYLPGSMVYIVNEQGEFVMTHGIDSTETITYENIPAYYDLHSDEQSQIIRTASGKKYIVSDKYSDTTGWHYIRAVPYTIVNRYSNIINTIWIFTLLTFVFLTAGFIVSGFMYSPIWQLKKKADTLEQTVQSDLLILRQQFLSQMIRVNRGLSLSIIHDRFKEYQIEFNTQQRVLMVIITIDQYEDFLKHYEQLDKFEILAHAKKIYGQSYPVLSIITDQPHLVVLLGIEDGHPIDHLAIRLISETFKEQIQQLYTTIFSIVIGSECQHLDRINVMYNKLKTPARYNSFLGEGRIIFSDPSLVTSTNEQTRVYKYPTDKEKRMVKALYAQQTDQALVYFDEITTYAKDFSYDVLLSAVNRAMLSINSVIEGILLDSHMKLPFNVNSFWHSVSTAESFPEIRQQFQLLFTQVVNMLSQINAGNPQDDIIQTAIDYMDQNFMIATLSSEAIASIIGVSTNYLRRVFKERKGTSIAGYINDLRIHQAEKLLVETDMSAKDIADRVGFANTNYFYTYFKKQCGMTPAMYRKLKQ